MVGRVIGKGGETIKSLQKNFGANIQIDQSTEPMKVTVSGQPHSVDMALGAVQEIISGGSPYLGPGSGGFGARPRLAAPCLPLCACPVVLIMLRARLPTTLQHLCAPVVWRVGRRCAPRGARYACCASFDRACPPRADGSRGGGGGGGFGGGGQPGYGAPQYPPAAGGFGYGGFPAQAAGPAAYGYGAYGGYAQPYAAPQAAYGGYGAGYGAPDPYAAAAAGAYGGYGGAAVGGAAVGGGGGGGGTWQELHDTEGRPYYYNTQTGVSQWEKPADMV